MISRQWILSGSNYGNELVVIDLDTKELVELLRASDEYKRIPLLH